MKKNSFDFVVLSPLELMRQRMETDLSIHLIETSSKSDFEGRVFQTDERGNINEFRYKASGFILVHSDADLSPLLLEVPVQESVCHAISRNLPSVCLIASTNMTLAPEEIVHGVISGVKRAYTMTKKNRGTLTIILVVTAPAVALLKLRLEEWANESVGA